MKTTGLFSMLVLMVSFFSFTSASGQTAAKNKAACASFYEAFNHKDLTKIATLVTDDFNDHALPPDMAAQTGLSGKPLFLAALKEYFNAFPDMQVRVIETVAEGNTVMVYLSMKGTHTGEFAGIPPTGKSIEISDVDIVKFDSNGKATEHWAVQDASLMMMQLGIAPMSKN